METVSIPIIHLTKEELAKLEGEFTWNFGSYFFIETSQGNFIWHDPDYGGDGSIQSYQGTYQKWIGSSFGRSKGNHIIGNYCGDFSYKEI
jgi:hypothetical protein